MTRPLAVLRERHADIAVRYGDVLRRDNRRHAVAAGVTGSMLTLLALCVASLDVDWWRVPAGLLNLGEIVRFMVPPEPGSYERALIYAKSLSETLAIALLGTLIAAILAFPIGFLAAKNVVANRIVHFLARRSLDTIRGIDVLVWALIWVSVVGLGPFAGILAITCSDFGTFGKLFSEAIETADRKPVEGVIAAGGSDLHGVRFGLLPQVLPIMASQVSTTSSPTRARRPSSASSARAASACISPSRSATLEWQHVSFIIVLILLAVATIDFLSSRLRFAIIGRKPGGA